MRTSIILPVIHTCLPAEFPNIKAHCLTHNKSAPAHYLRKGTWWRIGRVETFRPEGRGFESHSSHLGKSLTRSCLCSFGVKLRHSIRAVSGALLSSSGLEEAL